MKIIDLSVRDSYASVKWKHCLLLLLMFLFFIHYSYSQNPAIAAKAEIPYKNSIKGMAVPLLMYSSLSIGYERYITNQFMVEMVINNQYWFDEMGLPYYALCIMPGYKYYFVSKAKWRNNIWIGGYLLYRYQIDFHSENGIKNNHKLYDHGIGISFGKRMNLSKNKRWFFDLGCGVSSNMYGGAPLFSNSAREDKVFGWEMLFRPIVQFGKKF
jgi:hypothetical protein